MLVNIDLEFEPESCAGPLNPEEVASDEEMIGLKFDPDYLEFLQQCNGGRPRKRYFDVPDNTKVVERFLCITADYKDNPVHGPYDVGVVWSQVEDRLSEFHIPIAALFAGDLLCLDYEHREKPRVVWWDHERSEPDAPHAEFVANDFNEFLGMLYGDDKA